MGLSKTDSLSQVADLIPCPAVRGRPEEPGFLYRETSRRPAGEVAVVWPDDQWAIRRLAPARGRAAGRPCL